MRAWDEGDALIRRQEERRAEAHDETVRELEERGIELDPDSPPTHRHGDVEHASDHAHPHDHSGPGDRPVVGIVGAGPVGTALGVALSRAGWPVAAVASRDPARRERFRELVPGARGFAEANALLDAVELVLLAVPDDAIPEVAASLRPYSGQAVVHTSGLLGADALAPAMAAGTQAGGFHPLVSFADLELSLVALRGATVAIEGDPELAAHLGDMAEAIGAVPVRLAPGSKVAYHAAAVLAAGGVVALLDAIREVADIVGLDESGTLEIYLRLVRQTLANAEALGIAQSLTGPAARGDARTVAAHLRTIRAGAPGAVETYRALLDRGVAIAERRGTLAPEAAERLRRALAGAG